MISELLSLEGNGNGLTPNLFFLSFLHYFSLFLINFISYLYILTKFYKVLCYSKMTFEWFPMINPYTWPFSFFQVMTRPYFRMWATLLPSIKFETTSVNISGIVGLEALNALVYLWIRAIQYFLTLLESTELALQTSDKLF